MIPFNSPPFVGRELDYVKQAVCLNRKISGDGPFTARCTDFIRQMTGAGYAYLTTSGTHALEMAAMLAHIKPGDEVIMPSYTFVSTANAFLLRGAVPVFVDIRPDTMNIDERCIEQAITAKTRVIAVVHYAGISCEMDTILDIAKRHGLIVVEDAAQAVLSTYKGRYLGTIATFGAYSFHETKNFSMGEGGALLFNDEAYQQEAEIIREKGTDRSRYFRGEIDKYTWVDRGSSYLPSDINAAFLFAQLEESKTITKDRMHAWQLYYDSLRPLSEAGRIGLPYVPPECRHNAHMFYIKCADLAERTALIAFLRQRGIETAFHYIPLHSSAAGRKYARFCGEDRYTTAESERLLRLPMYYGLSKEDVGFIADCVTDYYDHLSGRAGVYDQIASVG